MQLDSDSYLRFIEKFEIFLKANGKQKSTVDSYRRDAEGFLNYLGIENIAIEQVDPKTLSDFQLWAAQQDKENSIRRKMIGVRIFFRFLSSEIFHLNESPLDATIIPSRNEALPQLLTNDQLEQLISNLESKKSLKDIRDLAIIQLISFEGLKASELIQLTWKDYLKTSTQSFLKITGSRARNIELSPSSQKSLDNYKACIIDLLGTSRPENIFIAFKGRNNHQILPKMSRHGLKFLIYDLGEKLEIKKLSAEILRHHALEWQLEQGKSPEDLMHHLGLRRLGNISKHILRKKFGENIEHGNS